MAVLQALQRLSTSRFASAEALVAPAAVARVFAALSCGDDFVATEAAHFLTRLWAPAVRAPPSFPLFLVPAHSFFLPPRGAPAYMTWEDDV